MSAKYYYAHEVGEMVGLTKQMVGRLANLQNLKTEKYGIWVEDAIPLPNGRIIHKSVFKYNIEAVNQILQLKANKKK